MAEKDTHRQAERRERSKINYNGIEGLIQRISDECLYSKEEAEQITLDLVTRAANAGVTIETVVAGFIDACAAMANKLMEDMKHG